MSTWLASNSLRTGLPYARPGVARTATSWQNGGKGAPRRNRCSRLIPSQSAKLRWRKVDRSPRGRLAGCKTAPWVHKSSLFGAPCTESIPGVRQFCGRDLPLVDWAQALPPPSWLRAKGQMNKNTWRRVRTAIPTPVLCHEYRTMALTNPPFISERYVKHRKKRHTSKWAPVLGRF